MTATKNDVHFNQVALGGNNNFYSVRVGRHIIDINDRDIDGSIVVTDLHVPYGGVTAEVAFQKYAGDLETAISEFHAALPEKLMTLADEIKNAPRRAWEGNVCTEMDKISDRVKKVQIEAGTHETNAKDVNNDGKTDRVTFTTDDNTNVLIDATKTFSWSYGEGEGLQQKCTVVDVTRAGVEEYLKIFDPIFE